MAHTSAFVTLTQVFVTLTQVFVTLTQVFVTLAQVFVTLAYAGVQAIATKKRLDSRLLGTDEILSLSGFSAQVSVIPA